MNKKVLLIILDGWGIGKNPAVSAVAAARTPFIDSLYKVYPNSKLQASEEGVGLPEGQMGNSEVGHLNIGAGRIVYQDLVRINNSFKSQSIEKNPVLIKTFDYLKWNNNALHLFGLLSNGGVHSHIEHLKGLLTLAYKNQIKNVFIHAFMDGRDTDPKAGAKYIEELEEHSAKTTGKIASVIGRFYAMDRDKRWERIKLAYDLLIYGKGQPFQNPVEGVLNSYHSNITDEFIKPIVIVNENSNPVSTIKDGDVVFSFNFRKDRARQLTTVLTQKNLPEFEMNTINIKYITMCTYNETFKNVDVIFGRDDPTMTLGEVLSKNGKNQIRIAETEKYPHVTFFFSGGREETFVGEKRILCPSPKVTTYDLKPEMSAVDIQNAIIPELNSKESDFICLNFANPDMVGHTGVFPAVVKACETVDKTTENVVSAALKNEYSILIIADHGNAEYMVNPDGTPHTAHTTNLVPFILVDHRFKPPVFDGKLCDIAPTILKLMGIPQPLEMTGKPLF